jgi:hypothetical protein
VIALATLAVFMLVLAIEIDWPFANMPHPGRRKRPVSGSRWPLPSPFPSGRQHGTLP